MLQHGQTFMLNDRSQSQMTMIPSVWDVPIRQIIMTENPGCQGVRAVKGKWRIIMCKGFVYEVPKMF